MSTAASVDTAGPTSSQRSSHQSVTKRLQNELMNLMMASVPGTGSASDEKPISAFPESDTNIFKWIATIPGPSGTPYEELKFRLTIQFSMDYPYTAPTVMFMPKTCYHPNVDYDTGTICLDILQEQWSACLNVHSLLLSVQSLLGEPNNDSPLNVTASRIWGGENYREQVLKHFNDE